MSMYGPYFEEKTPTRRYYSESKAGYIVRLYEGLIERNIEKIDKNFSQMDFENSYSREQMKKEKDEIIKSLRELKTKYEAITFY